MTGWTWEEVREWAEEYHGDCSGSVKALLKKALAGDTQAWGRLSELYTTRDQPGSSASVNTRIKEVA